MRQIFDFSLITLWLGGFLTSYSLLGLVEVLLSIFFIRLIYKIIRKENLSTWYLTLKD